MRHLILFFTALLLAACGGGGGASVLDTSRNAGPCPTYGAIYDVARFVEFDGSSDSFANIAYSGEIAGVRLFCRYVDDAPIDAELEIDFAFGKGPKGQANRHVYPYFVAVTRPSGKVLAKRRLAVRAEFGDMPVDAKTITVDNIIIPRADQSISGSNFEVVVGFDLSEEQIAFNRSGSRFRLDAGPAARGG